MRDHDWAAPRHVTGSNFDLRDSIAGAGRFDSANDLPWGSTTLGTCMGLLSWGRRGGDETYDSNPECSAIATWTVVCMVATFEHVQ